MPLRSGLPRRCWKRCGATRACFPPRWVTPCCRQVLRCCRRRSPSRQRCRPAWGRLLWRRCRSAVHAAGRRSTCVWRPSTPCSTAWPGSRWTGRRRISGTRCRASTAWPTAGCGCTPTSRTTATACCACLGCRPGRTRRALPSRPPWRAGVPRRSKTLLPPPAWWSPPRARSPRGTPTRRRQRCVPSRWWRSSASATRRPGPGRRGHRRVRAACRWTACVCWS